MSGGDWKDLYKGVEEGDYSLVHFHIKNGIDLNYQHPEILMLPLVVAIKNHHTDMALLLLQNGADPLLESYYDNMNAVEAAIKYKNNIVLEKLKKMGVYFGFKAELKLFIIKVFQN